MSNTYTFIQLKTMYLNFCTVFFCRCDVWSVLIHTLLELIALKIYTFFFSFSTLFFARELLLNSLSGQWKMLSIQIQWTLTQMPVANSISILNIDTCSIEQKLIHFQHKSFAKRHKTNGQSDHHLSKMNVLSILIGRTKSINSIHPQSQKRKHLLCSCPFMNYTSTEMQTN